MVLEEEAVGSSAVERPAKKLRVIDRLVTDSRTVAPNHTAGFSENVERFNAETGKNLDKT
ncbi:hypothetical protein LMG27174_00328 [Paraburkholderia rhynchosiae]|uniref:Uncharacterized protein n=2 Tax=Paraburkholderia rhynchosiae TaxID=487049 RepID=A0A2N7WXQ1_9BURK|nr:hypothetical protein C0Z16_01640 [Paraburkholderia rhynchosiae]CAB3638581.1 hypothetical protein LMG27174_00328 [Paraburkholderia rhynchosiae]